MRATMIFVLSLSLFLFASCGSEDSASSGNSIIDCIEQGIGQQAKGGGCGCGGISQLHSIDEIIKPYNEGQSSASINAAFSNLCKIAPWSNLCPIDNAFSVSSDDPGPVSN